MSDALTELRDRSPVSEAGSAIAKKSARSFWTQFIGASTALGVSVGAYLSYQIVRNFMLDNLKREVLSRVEHRTDEVDSWLGTLKTRVDTLANVELIRKMDWSIAAPYLKAEVTRVGDFSSFGVAQPDGWRDNTAAKKRADVSDRQWFQQAIAGKLYVDDPLIARATGLPTVVIAAPIRDAAKSSPVGVMSGLVNVDRITQEVNRLQYGQDSYAFALNSKGQAIVHPNKALMWTLEKTAPSLLTAEPGLASAARRMVSRQQGIELVSLDGNQKYIAFASLKQANWSIGLVMPRSNIESQLILLDGIAAAILCLAGVSMAAIAAAYSGEQVRLQRAQTEIEATNQNLERKVAERTQELENAREDLEKRVAERTQELEKALEHLTRTQSQLVQTEKMSSLGQLVAGVAHEINNPVNFIHGNLSHIDDYVQDLLSLVHLYGHKYPDAEPEIEAALEEIDLIFITEDLPKTLASMKVGTQRIREIVQSLRIFSRIDEAELKAVDLHAGIDSTLLILKHRLKAHPDRPEIIVTKRYGKIPLVECYAGQLNQVLMNILSNAIDAVEDRDYNSPGRITITTSIESESDAGALVRIAIADNGAGMPEQVRQKIFDPFFTTKPVGKGTGMGMSISYQIVTEKHSGTLSCVSTPGEGTEFTIQIPIRQILVKTPIQYD